MLPKFSIDYIAMPKHSHRVFTRQTEAVRFLDGLFIAFCGSF